MQHFFFVIRKAVILFAIIFAITGVTLALLPKVLVCEKDIIYSVKKNTTITAVADELKSSGAIENLLALKIANKIISIFDSNYKLKMGDFSVKRGMNYYEILHLLSSNNYYFQSLTFPEGLTIKQIIKIINSSSLSGDITIDFAEGELMPETYHYTSFDTKDTLIKRMKNDMETFLNKAWSENKNIFLKTKKDLLTFASIVEKETGVPKERPLVASVFFNRLKQNMKLQSDPTIIYEITKGETNFGRKITKTDINTGSEYNTYKIYGLPKSPIACPSKESIIASINPPETEYLYFVAIGDNSGRHIFAKEYDAHLKNVDEYRKTRLEKEMKHENRLSE